MAFSYSDTILVLLLPNCWLGKLVCCFLLLPPLPDATVATWRVWVLLTISTDDNAEVLKRPTNSPDNLHCWVGVSGGARQMICSHPRGGSGKICGTAPPFGIIFPSASNMTSPPPLTEKTLEESSGCLMGSRSPTLCLSMPCACLYR